LQRTNTKACFTNTLAYFSAPQVTKKKGLGHLHLAGLAGERLSVTVTLFVTLSELDGVEHDAAEGAPRLF
jgi:hypothetical protein